MNSTAGASALARRRAGWLCGGILLAQVGAGLPAPLYPQYQDRWALSTAALTGLFVALIAGILATLILAGRAVAVLGYRGSLVVSAGLGVLAATGFALAFSPWLLVVASVSAGMSIGGFSAVVPGAMLDPALPGGAATVSALVAAGNAVGLAVGPVWSGLLTELAPWPGRLVFVIQMAAFAVVGVMVYRLAPNVAVPASRTLPSFRVDAASQRSFALACAGGCVAFSVGGLYSSLGSLVAVDLLDVHSGTALGLIVSLLFIANAAAGMTLSKLETHLALRTGLVLLAAGLAVAASAPVLGAAAVFYAGTALTGAGQGTVIAVGVGVVSGIAKTNKQTATTAAFFLVCYLGTAVPALITGAVATAVGLNVALLSFSLSIGLMSLVLAVLVRSRTTEDDLDPA